MLGSESEGKRAPISQAHPMHGVREKLTDRVDTDAELCSDVRSEHSLEVVCGGFACVVWGQLKHRSVLRIKLRENSSTRSSQAKWFWFSLVRPEIDVMLITPVRYSSKIAFPLGSRPLVNFSSRGKKAMVTMNPEVAFVLKTLSQSSYVSLRCASE